MKKLLIIFLVLISVCICQETNEEEANNFIKSLTKNSFIDPHVRLFFENIMKNEEKIILLKEMVISIIRKDDEITPTSKCEHKLFINQKKYCLRFFRELKDIYFKKFIN